MMDRKSFEDFYNGLAGYEREILGWFEEALAEKHDHEVGLLMNQIHGLRLQLAAQELRVDEVLNLFVR